MKLFEYTIIDPIYKAINRMLLKLIKPDVVFESIKSLDMETIERLKIEYGIEAVILDVDDTLRRNFNVIPKYNREWIKELKKHIKVIVVSNGLDGNIKQFFNNLGIEYIAFAFKPLKRSFSKACTILNVEPEKVLVIGDGLWGDVYGGKRNNMKTALIRNV